jgi:hypothetical protein
MLLKRPDGMALHLYNGTDKPLGVRMTAVKEGGTWEVETLTHAANCKVTVAPHAVARLALSAD